LQGLRELGYEEGKNLIIEWRFAEGNDERLAMMATELVKLKVDLIVAVASPAIRAARKATSTIPIVMPLTGDPVGSGFAVSLARPGGNITGLSLMSDEISAKYLEFLKALKPKLSSAALLGNPGSSTYPAALKSIQTAANQLGVNFVRMEIRTAEDIEQGFSKLVRDRVEAVVIPPEALVLSQRRLIAQLASKYRLLAVLRRARPGSNLPHFCRWRRA
jgi:putative ABC transport system substrate-binding protein